MKFNFHSPPNDGKITAQGGAAKCECALKTKIRRAKKPCELDATP